MERVVRLSQVRSDVREREKEREPQVVVLRVGCDVPVHRNVPVHRRSAVMGIRRHEAELVADRALRLLAQPQERQRSDRTAVAASMRNDGAEPNIATGVVELSLQRQGDGYVH